MFQDSVDQQMLDNERYRLKDQKDLLVKLGDDLAAVNTKTNAARRILDEIDELAKMHPEEIGAVDQQRANEAIPKLAAEKARLELRISNVKRGIDVIEAGIARFDLPKLARLEKIRGLFRQIAG